MARLAVFAVLAVAGARVDVIGALDKVHNVEEALPALKVRPAPRIVAAGGSASSPLSTARSSPAGCMAHPPLARPTRPHQTLH